MIISVKKQFVSLLNHKSIGFYKDGLLLFFSYAVSAATSLLTTYFLSKHLSSQTFGEYRYIISTMSVITGLSMSGLGQNLTTLIAGGTMPDIKYFFKYQLKWSSIGGFLGIIIGLYYFLNNNYTLGTSIVIVSLLAPFINATQLINNYLNGQNNFKKIARFQNIINIVTTVAMLISLFFINKSVVFIIAVFYITYLLTYSVFFLYELKNFKSNDSFNLANFHKKNIATSINNVISQINLVFDKIFAFTIVGGTALAFYSFSTLFVDQFRSIIKIGTSISITKLVNSPEEKSSVFKSQLFKIITICLLFIGAYFLFGSFIFKTFFNNYFDAFKYSLIIAFTVIPLSIISFIQNILQADLNTKKMIYLNIIQFAVNVVSFTPVLWYKNIDALIIAKFTASFLSLLIILLYKKLFLTKTNHQPHS